MKALSLALALAVAWPAAVRAQPQAKVSPIKAIPAMIVAPLVTAFQYVFTTPPRVPFTPTEGRHYYHGTSWADLTAAVQNGGALSPQVTFLARGHHHSQPYADARARKRKSKSIVLEFQDEPVDPLNSFSGRPGGQYPAYRAHSPVPLEHLTPLSKQAVMDELERQGADEKTRAAFSRALGL